MRSIVVGIGVGAVLVACASSEPVDLGASCSALSAPKACAKGNKIAACSGGKWQESETCPGPKGCWIMKVGHGSTTPVCDEGLARAGNPCTDGRDLICSEDRRSRLGCRGGRWYVQANCPRGCSYNPQGITCE